MTNAAVGALLREVWKSAQDDSDARVYDEVLEEIVQRASYEQSLGKADIGALVVWKRLNASTRWSRRLMLTPDVDVREATSRAWQLANDPTLAIPEAGGQARAALWSTPGMGGTGAIASAVLLALSPQRMAVWDSRAQSALSVIGRSPERGEGRYRRYLEIVLDLAEAMTDPNSPGKNILPRDVNLALFHAGGDQRLLDQLRQAAALPQQ